MDLLLAFDIGTSSLRTALFTVGAERLPATTAQEHVPLKTTQDGGAEFAPELLLEAALSCLRKTMAAYRSDPALRQRKIIGVGTSCFWHSLVGIAENNCPITPVITWADSRCASDAVRLREALDERAIHALTGCMLRPSFWPAKLEWLRRVDPATYRAVRQWISPGEWLHRELCGNAFCAYGMATGTGLFDPAKLAWVPELLARFQLCPEHLPEIADTPSRLLPKWASEFPELAEIPWYPGIGDGAASNLGAGATRPGLAAINFGTSAALRVMNEGPCAGAPYGLFCYRVDDRRYLVGGAVSNAGNLRAWCLREWQLPADPAQLEAEMAARPEPNHGLVVLPFWTAERAPTWRDDLKGAIIGLTQATTAIDILQATTEAVDYRIARIAEMVSAHSQSACRYIVSGGISKSPSDIQRMADILAAPLTIGRESEASLRGAAVFAAEKLGLPIAPVSFGKTVEPRPAISAIYAKHKQRQACLEAALEGLAFPA